MGLLCHCVTVPPFSWVPYVYLEEQSSRRRHYRSGMGRRRQIFGKGPTFVGVVGTSAEFYDGICEGATGAVKVSASVSSFRGPLQSGSETISRQLWNSHYQ